MAIIIPSKNIYDIKNPKIIDNVINKVYVEETVVKPDNDYEVTVYNEDYALENVSTEENSQTEYIDATALNAAGDTMRNVRGACGIKYKIEKFTIPEILIPKIKDNKFINKIYADVDDEGNPEIKVSLRAKQQLFTGVTSYQPSSNKFLFDNELELKEEKDFLGTQDFSIENNVSSQVASLPESMPHERPTSIHYLTTNNNELKIGSYLYANSNNNWYPEGIVEIDVNKTTNIMSESFSLTEETIDDIEYYKLSSNEIFVGVEVYMASCIFESTSDISSLNGYVRSPATRILIDPEELSVTVYGNTIGISLNDGNKSYGTGDKPYTISGSEILQDKGTVNTVKISEQLANNIYLSQYKNGKEVATILCDISNYYSDEDKWIVAYLGSEFPQNLSSREDVEFDDLNGFYIYTPPPNTIIKSVKTDISGYLYEDIYVDIEASLVNNKIYLKPSEDAEALTVAYVEYEVKNPIVINIKENKKMCFNEGDEVVPMIRNYKGADEPMSKYDNGNPKKFRVVGTNIIYDGAVWQELTLQEIRKGN